MKHLSSKISYEINPNDEYPKNYTGYIKIFTKDGRQYSASQNCLRGGRKAPLFKDEVERKFEDNLKFGNIQLNEINNLKHFINNIFDFDSLKLIDKIKFN